MTNKSSASVQSQLLFRAGQTSPGSCAQLQILVINSSSVPGGQLGNSRTSASPGTLYAIFMTAKFTIIEKVIATLLIILAVLELLSVIWQLQFSITIGFESKRLTWESISFLTIFKNYHLSVFLSLLTLFAATALLFTKKIGWVLSIAASIVHCLSYIMLLLNLKATYTKSANSTFYVINGLFIGLCLTFVILLLQKAFKDKYFVSNKMWLTIIVVLGIYLIDRVLLFLLK